MTPDKALLTSTEVAALIMVTPSTVRRWAAAGRIPTITTPGGRRRFRRADVDALLTARARDERTAS